MSAANRRETEREPLVYGEVLGSLVVVPKWLARVYADDVQAIRSLSTWGEARRFEPAYLDFPGLDPDEDYADPPGDEEGPSDDDVFDVGTTILAQKAEWPPSLATVALNVFPQDLGDIGEEHDHFPGLPTLYIDPAQEAEVVTEIRARGYTIHRDDDLVHDD